jgi:hypothetical protein
MIYVCIKQVLDNQSIESIGKANDAQRYAKQRASRQLGLEAVEDRLRLIHPHDPRSRPRINRVHREGKEAQDMQSKE